MKRLIALISVLALGILALPMQAQAGTYPGGSLTLTTGDLTVWPDHCGESHYSVSGSFKNAADWNVDLTVYDPHGVLSGGDYFDSSDPVTSGTEYLCGDYDLPGRYRVTAEYETYDADYNTLEHQTVTGYFTFTKRTKQASSLTVTKTRLGAHKWKIVGRLTKAGKAWAGHRVQIQAHGAAWGGWGVLKTKTTNRTGRVTFTSRPSRGAGKFPIRLHSTGGGYVRDANSRSFRLTPR